MVNITDEAVLAALDKWRDHEFDGTLDNPRMRAALTAAFPHLQPVDVAAVTRPVANIESRTPKEVFDIMCDRIRAISDDPALKVPQHNNN